MTAGTNQTILQPPTPLFFGRGLARTPPLRGRSRRAPDRLGFKEQILDFLNLLLKLGLDKKLFCGQNHEKKFYFEHLNIHLLFPFIFYLFIGLKLKIEVKNFFCTSFLKNCF